MPSIPVTYDQLKEHLTEQLGFLERSCRSYDEGDTAEAKRLATTIRVLVHDTDNSTSLLQQLGVKESIPYWSVPLGEAGQAVTYMGIGMSIGGDGTSYAPILFAPKRFHQFADWWDVEPLRKLCTTSQIARYAA